MILKFVSDWDHDGAAVVESSADGSLVGTRSNGCRSLASVSSSMLRALLPKGGIIVPDGEQPGRDVLKGATRVGGCFGGGYPADNTTKSATTGIKP